MTKTVIRSFPKKGFTWEYWNLWARSVYADMNSTFFLNKMQY